MPDLDERQQKPWLVKNIEVILSPAYVIRKQALDRLRQCELKYEGSLSTAEIQQRAVAGVIAKYGNLAAIGGLITSIPTIIPGIGAAVGILGGVSADFIACMKLQIEMVWEIATIYGYDVSFFEDEQNLAYVIACVGATNQLESGDSGKKKSKQAFARMTKSYLREALVVTVPKLITRAGIIFMRTTLQKTIPLGIGAVLGASANRILTKSVGIQAQEFYAQRRDLEEVSGQIGPRSTPALAPRS